MKRLISILLALLLISCSNENSADNNLTYENTKRIDSIPRDTFKITYKAASIDSNFYPSKQLIELAKHIDSAGYLYDTSRIKKVSHYGWSDSTITSDNYVFYKKKLDGSKIISFYNSFKNYRDSANPFAKGLVNYDLFKDKISIIDYYYVQKTRTSLMVDGDIEEWLFPNEESAKKAVNDVNRVKWLVFFNTESFCCQIGRRMYIFHVRASGFSYQMKKFFKWFVKTNNANVPNNKQPQ